MKNHHPQKNRADPVSSRRKFLQLAAAAADHLRATRCGAERAAAEEARAQHLLREESGRLGWDHHALRQASKGHRRKVRLAARLRKETTMKLKWVAQHLEMGSRTHVSNLLAGRRKHRSLKSENSHL